MANSGTFLTASLFEPFDEDEFNHFDSPVLGKEVIFNMANPEISHPISKQYVMKKAYIEEEEEEVVDASGGLTTGLSSMTEVIILVH